MARYSLDQLRTMVSIVELIKYRKLDFRLFRDGKNIKAYTPLRNSDGNPVYNGSHPVKDRNFLISRLTKYDKETKNEIGKYEVYYDLNSFERNNPKSVFDFVHEEIFKSKDSKVDFKKVIGFLNEYVNSQDFVNIDNSTVAFESKHRKDRENQPNRAKDCYFSPEQITFDYFKSRGLKSYSTPVFFNTYGTYKNDQVKEGKINPGTKPAFPLLDTDRKLHTLQWIDFSQQKNVHSGKFFFEDVNKSDAIFMSNYQKGATNLAVLTEAPEKGMAHYQLYESDLNKHNKFPQYFATCGQPSLDQFANLSSQMFSRGIKDLVTAFDNDLSGVRYTLAVMIFLNLRDEKNEIPVTISGKELENNKVEILINAKTNSKEIDRVFETINWGNVAIKEMNFGNTLQLTGTPKEILENIKTNNIITHQAISKDFLDDLKLPDNRLPKKFEFNQSRSKENGLGL